MAKVKAKAKGKIKGLSTGTLILGGYQQIADPAAATALTIPPGTVRAMFVAEVQNIRWRGDGTDPTATVGMIMKPADPPLLLELFPLANLKFIRATAGAILNVQYFKKSP